MQPHFGYLLKAVRDLKKKASGRRTPKEKQPEKKWYENLFFAASGFATILGLFVGLQNFMEDQPDLKFQIDNITIRGFDDEASDIVEILNNIETEHGIVTGGIILALRDTAVNLNYWDSLRVRNFLRDICARISFFQRSINRWDASRIKLIGGTTLLWPDETSLDLLTDKNAPIIFSEFFNPHTNKLNLVSETAKRNLFRYAHSLYQPFQQKDRILVAAGLRKIRGKLESILDSRSHQLEFTFSVVNKSRQANILEKVSLVDIYYTKNNRNWYGSFPIRVEEQNIISAIGLGSIKLKTDVFDSLRNESTLH